MDSNPRLTLRDEQAAVTRRRIGDAARRLFNERGYGATTLQAIAAEAGVAVQTVYAVYRSKAGILRSLRSAVASHPEADELYEAAIRAASAADRLELFARSIRRRWEWGADVVRIYAEAASTDPALRQELGHVLSRRREGIGRLAATLEGALRRDVSDAASILDALTLPDVYAELVGVDGWTPDQYETWLARTLRDQLLPA
jgi:AcrR family transcriptional regulator